MRSVGTSSGANVFAVISYAKYAGADIDTTPAMPPGDLAALTSTA